MTSKPEKHLCYVYIMLPGETEFVTAGRYELTVTAGGSYLGRFVYGKSYLARANAVEFDPIELKLASRVYETALLKGVFGALRDAGPDYWGRLVIEKALGATGLSEMEYLLKSPDDRAGALSFGKGEKPPAPNWKFNKTLQLPQLQKIALALAKQNEKPTGPEAEQIDQLMLLRTSMGGARPKAVIEDDDGLWIAKFNKPTDKWNNATVERAMLVLAQSCGISVAASRIQRVAGRDVLLVKRFDRKKTKKGYQRARMVSGLTLLHADETERSRWSYVTLAEELRRVCANPKKNAEELFRRMCFNALISNIDDHPRNHAIIAMDREWKLSPAYDLTPATPVSVERDLAMICGDLGRRASAKNMISQSRRFLVVPDNAAKIISEMEDRVRRTWYGVARAEGVSERDCNTIAGAFGYEGFGYPLEDEEEQDDASLSVGRRAP
jgi:serine/threonine-protein kinase HipA